MGKKIREDQLNQVSENAGISGFAPLNHEDIEFIKQKLLPKNRRSFYQLAIVLCALSFAMPYIPAKWTGKTLIQSMTYPNAVLLCLAVIFCFSLYVYYKILYGMQKDLNSGYKYIFVTTIKRKVWHNKDKFELLMIEVPKELSTQKFKYSIEKSSRWYQGDRIIIEYLRHSETMLREPRVFTS